MWNVRKLVCSCSTAGCTTTQRLFVCCPLHATQTEILLFTYRCTCSQRENYSGQFSLSVNGNRHDADANMVRLYDFRHQCVSPPLLILLSPSLCWPRTQFHLSSATTWVGTLWERDRSLWTCGHNSLVLLGPARLTWLPPCVSAGRSKNTLHFFHQHPHASVSCSQWNNHSVHVSFLQFVCCCY